MFRSLPDHHQGFCALLVKITELICEYPCVVMRQHNIQCTYVMFGVVRCAVCRLHNSSLTAWPLKIPEKNSTSFMFSDEFVTNVFFL
jgi:hypothetical protein